MEDLVVLGTVLAGLVAILLVAAQPIAARLVALRARRLPTHLALRLEEEWLAELGFIASRLGKLAFALALLLTRRRDLAAPGDAAENGFPEQHAFLFAAVRSRKAFVVLTTLVLSAASYGASYLFPVVYEAEAFLRSAPRRESQEQIAGLPYMSLSDRGDVLQKMVQGNGLLENVSAEAEAPQRPVLDIETLRSGVTVVSSPDGAEGGSLIAIRYQGPDAKIAVTVANLFARQLVVADNKGRWDQSQAALHFLQQQLVAMKAELVEKGHDNRESSKSHRADSILADKILEAEEEAKVAAYKSLLGKLTEAGMAASISVSRFRLLNIAESARQVGPDRRAFAILGAVAGFGLGCTAIFGIGRRSRRAVTVTTSG